MLVGEGAELEEGLGSEELGGREVIRSIVDGCDVEQVEDEICVFVGGLLSREAAIDHGGDAIVERLCLVEGAHVLWREKVIVAAEFSVCAALGPFEPRSIFTATTVADEVNWYQLVAVEG